MYRMFGYGSDDPNTYCDYVRKAKEKLATEVVPRNFRVEISEGQIRQSATIASFQYAQKQLFYEGYGHTIPTFSYMSVQAFGGEAYYTSPLPSGDPMNDRATCPKDPTLGMFYDLCLELDVLRSQIEELKGNCVLKGNHFDSDVEPATGNYFGRAAKAPPAPEGANPFAASAANTPFSFKPPERHVASSGGFTFGASPATAPIQPEMDELRAELAELKKAKDIQKNIQSEVEELRAELVELKKAKDIVLPELKKAKDIQSEVEELRAELVELKKAKDIVLPELKKAKDIQSEVDELRAELVELKKAKDIQSEVEELRAELAELKPKQRPKGKFGFFHKQS